MTAANFVIGQSTMTTDFVNRGSLVPQATGFENPTSIIQAAGRTFVIDQTNSRVLSYNSLNLTNSSVPDIVLGQADFVTKGANSGGVSARSLSSPIQISSDGVKLAIADDANNRVLIWNNIPTSSNQPADVVVGQPDMISVGANTGGISASTLASPRGVVLAENELIIADTANRRILVYHAIPTTNGEAASLVLGQNDFTSRLAVPSGLRPLQRIMPVFLSYKNGHFILNFDTGSIYIWKGLPSKKNQEADHLMGAPAGHRATVAYPVPLDYDLLSEARNFYSDGTRLWTAQSYASRIVAAPIPEITPESLLSSKRDISLSIESCTNRSAILFNESTQPSRER